MKLDLGLGILSVLFCVFTSTAQAQNEDDRFKNLFQIDDLYVEPQARVQELSRGGAGPTHWGLGIRSQFASWVDAGISIGDSTDLHRPLWSETPQGSVSILEVKGTLHSILGDVYAGQFRVPWGLQSQKTSELWLPRTLLYENGYFPLHDVGAGLYTELQGFYMNIAVHNGEGGNLENLDSRMFVTGQWGYKGVANSNLGFGATAGRLSAPNASVETRYRGMNAFFGFNIFGLGLQLEGSIIQSLTQTTQIDTIAWNTDLEHPLSERFNLIARYEQLNPNAKIPSNILGRAYLGCEFHSRDNISRLFVFMIKNNESLQEAPNDAVLVVWRIAPPVR